jgi:hypothetical protein
VKIVTYNYQFRKIKKAPNQNAKDFLRMLHKLNQKIHELNLSNEIEISKRLGTLKKSKIYIPDTVRGFKLFSYCKQPDQPSYKPKKPKILVETLEQDKLLQTLTTEESTPMPKSPQTHSIKAKIEIKSNYH